MVISKRKAAALKRFQTCSLTITCMNGNEVIVSQIELANVKKWLLKNDPDLVSDVFRKTMFRIVKSRVEMSRENVNEAEREVVRSFWSLLRKYREGFEGSIISMSKLGALLRYILIPCSDSALVDFIISRFMKIYVSAYIIEGFNGANYVVTNIGNIARLLIFGFRAPQQLPAAVPEPGNNNMDVIAETDPRYCNAMMSDSCSAYLNRHSDILGKRDFSKLSFTGRRAVNRVTIASRFCRQSLMATLPEIFTAQCYGDFGSVVSFVEKAPAKALAAAVYSTRDDVVELIKERLGMGGSIVKTFTVAEGILSIYNI